MFKKRQTIFSRLTVCLCVFFLTILPARLHAEDAPAEQADKPGAEKVELPGIKIDAKNKRVDVSSKVALDEGLLELIACTNDTKEHESLVIIDAVPMHIHAALLLIGATNGHPARVVPANEEKTQWLHLPPRGDEITVSLVFADPEDAEKMIERPISDFLKRSDRGEALGQGDEQDQEGPAEVFASFLFAGSVLIKGENGEQQYVADESGNVISISTFGDELLCLPSRQSQENHALVWAVDGKHLPKVGSKVTLRLTLQEQPEQDAK